MPALERTANPNSLKAMQAWLKQAIGVPGLLVQVWSALSIVFSIALMALVPRIGILVSGCLALAVHVWLHLGSRKAVLSGTCFGPKTFFVVKKALNYFAFIQFCFHSIALVLAWSASSLADTGYYALYAVSALVSGSYLPIFFIMNSRRNQVEHGIMQVISKNGRNKYRPLNVYRGFLPGLLSWVDALAWASAVVIFINSLFFQLYQIPSESMVPDLYIGTRVFTVKTLTNPEIPLSLVRVPLVAGIDRFDQYVLSNPRYNFKKEQVLTDFWHNFLYMISFTKIQFPRLDEYGQEIADPLIKRLIGLPGEQLLMADDVVYVRDGGTGDYRMLTGEANHAYNYVNDLPIDLSRVRGISIQPADRARMLAWDAEKQAVQADYAARRQRYLDWFDTLPARWQAARLDADRLPTLEAGARSFRINDNSIVNESRLAGWLRWSLTDHAAFLGQLEDFLTLWQSAAAPANRWEESALATNLLFKVKAMEALLALGDGLLAGSDYSWELQLRELGDYHDRYVRRYFDLRNFAPFPNEGGLPAGEYFFMGDNRYNSVDFRHLNHYHFVEKPLYSKDPWSLAYSSNQQLFSLNRSRIKGKALFSLF